MVRRPDRYNIRSQNKGGIRKSEIRIIKSPKNLSVQFQRGASQGDIIVDRARYMDAVTLDVARRR